MFGSLQDHRERRGKIWSTSADLAWDWNWDLKYGPKNDHLFHWFGRYARVVPKVGSEAVPRHSKKVNWSRLSRCQLTLGESKATLAIKRLFYALFFISGVLKSLTICILCSIILTKEWKNFIVIRQVNQQYAVNLRLFQWPNLESFWKSPMQLCKVLIGIVAYFCSSFQSLEPKIDSGQASTFPKAFVVNYWSELAIVYSTDDLNRFCLYCKLQNRMEHDS